MKTTVDTDLILDATDEAKICLSCNRKKCSPNCSRYRREMKRLSGKETRMERVHRLIEEEYEEALSHKYILNPLAYAIHQVWKIIDSEGRAKNEKG